MGGEGEGGGEGGVETVSGEERGESVAERAAIPRERRKKQEERSNSVKRERGKEGGGDGEQINSCR